MSRDVLSSNARGRFFLDGNESETESIVDDPSANRLRSPITAAGGGGGKVTFKATINGRDVELGYLRICQAESVRGQLENPKAECQIFLNDGLGTDDNNMQKALIVEIGGGILEIHPSILASLQHLVNGTPPAAPTPVGAVSRVQSPNGRYVWNMQTDRGPLENMVLYDTHNKADESTWTPIGIVRVTPLP